MRRRRACPSRIRSMRAAAAATSAECVASSIVTPSSRFSSASSASTRGAVVRIEVAGRLVGDEQRRAGARARGRWPRAASRRPTPAADSASADARCRRARPARAARASASCAVMPPSRHGSAMLSPRVSVGSRLKNWNTKPMRSRRSARQRVVVERREVAALEREPCRRSADPSRRTGAAASTCRSPTGPSAPRSPPASSVSDTPRRAVTGAAPPV